MMPVVRINDATFADLSTLKTWLGTKTPSDTIDRVVREALEQLGIERDREQDTSVAAATDGVMEFDTTPGLSFTKPISASVNGQAIESPRWSSILQTTISQLKAEGLEGEQLVRQLYIPAKAGRYEDEGFKHYPELGISVQGQSAADAWKEIERLARHWAIPVSVKFEWRHNDKAQFPGKTGVLRAGGA